MGIARLLPWAILFLLGRIDHRRMKETFLTVFLKHREVSEITVIGVRFAEEKLPHLCYREAIQRLAWHRSLGHEIVILTASPAPWIAPWCSRNGYAWIGTVLDISGTRYTGRIAGANCRGVEKARRLRDAFDLQQYDTVYAYGNTPADRYFMQMANVSFYKPFRR